EGRAKRGEEQHEHQKLEPERAAVEPREPLDGVAVGQPPSDSDQDQGRGGRGRRRREKQQPEERRLGPERPVRDREQDARVAGEEETEEASYHRNKVLDP